MYPLCSVIMTLRELTCAMDRKAKVDGGWKGLRS